MKNSFPLLVVTFMLSACLFAQQDIEKITANFEFNWNEYLLPESSFLIYHGSNGAYFIDSLGRRISNQTYLDIKTGGKHHFIVQDESGFHLLDATLKYVTQKAYDQINLNFGSELELTSKEGTSYYCWQQESKSYAFTDVSEPPPPWPEAQKRKYNSYLGNGINPKFKAKRIEKLRLGIDMTQTLSIGQKGKNVLVLKDDEVVYKGPTKPTLFNELIITDGKATHSIYHPTSKDPILENCEQFWFVGSFLIASIKGTTQKHIISNSGKIILSSVGEIHYYDYKFGGNQYSFFCDGRSVINLNGNRVYHSDGQLIGVGEHYIYAGHSGGYLGNLTHDVQMNCTNFERIGVLTVGKIGRSDWRLFDPKSILINSFDDYFYDQGDSLLVCTKEMKTIVCDPFRGEVIQAFPEGVRAVQSRNKTDWKYFKLKKKSDGIMLEGRFDPEEGTIVEPKYRKIEWLESANYYVVITEKGLIRYLNRDGQELFD